jgi:Ca2+-binding EF-hand superfamily protein
MSGSKKKAAKSSSNVFSMFTQNQVAEFKEAFAFIDQDKDGIISKGDIRATFDQMGRLTSDKELDEMLSEASGPVNFTMFLTIFGARVSGMDEEDVIINAFHIFDEGEGTVSEEKLRKMLCTFGQKLNDQEANDAFGEAPVHANGKIDLKKWANVLTKGCEDPEAGK